MKPSESKTKTGNKKKPTDDHRQRITKNRPSAADIPESKLLGDNCQNIICDSHDQSDQGSSMYYFYPRFNEHPYGDKNNYSHCHEQSRGLIR